MKINLMLAAACAGLLGFGASTQAQTLLFSYVEQGGLDFSFEQSSTPTPISYNSDYDTQVAVTDFTGNIGPYTSMYWYASVALGMFDTSDFYYVVYGPQVYSGPESNPVFAPGVFPGQDQTDGLDGVLTVSVVPEPASWGLMLVGVGVIGVGLRASRKAAAAA